MSPHIIEHLPANFGIILFLTGIVCSLGLIYRYYKLTHKVSNQPKAIVQNNIEEQITKSAGQFYSRDHRFDLEHFDKDEEMYHEHMKNRKKYTHLYELEKHFR